MRHPSQYDQYVLDLQAAGAVRGHYMVGGQVSQRRTAAVALQAVRQIVAVGLHQARYAAVIGEERRERSAVSPVYRSLETGYEF